MRNSQTQKMEKVKKDLIIALKDCDLSEARSVIKKLQESLYSISNFEKAKEDAYKKEVI